MLDETQENQLQQWAIEYLTRYRTYYAPEVGRKLRDSDPTCSDIELEIERFSLLFPKEMRAAVILKFIILTLMESRNDSEIGFVAAGPLENLIGNYLDEAEIPIISQAEVNAKLRKALTGVWQSMGSKPRTVLDRILKKFNLTYGSL